MPLRRSASVLLALLLVLAIAAPVAAAKGGNSAGSAACENGGYVNWTRQDGTTFKNEGACVKYAAKNTLKTAATVEVSYIPRTLGSGQSAISSILTWTGLEPGSLIRFVVLLEDGRLIYSWQNSVPSGSGSYSVWGPLCTELARGIGSVTVTATPVGSGPVAFPQSVPQFGAETGCEAPV